MLYIGVDLGTSAVKLLLMDEKGGIVNIVSREYPLYFPNPGWSEQNPQDWYEQTMEGIKELTASCDKTQVAGISFGGQMHGLVILDKEDLGDPAGYFVERWKDSGGDRLSEPGDRKRKAVGIHSQYCICRLYRPKDPLGKKTRTGKF